MIYILYHPDDESEVKENLIPLLDGKEYKLVEYPNPEFKPGNASVLITYLSDEYLREFLPRAANHHPPDTARHHDRSDDDLGRG